MKHVALLRGINVGGNKKVPMADLKKAMENAGMTDVKTLLNSGNVVFEAKSKGAALKKELEIVIKERFSFDVPVILRTMSDIEKLVDTDPFKGITTDENTRLYITFLSDKPTSKLKIPYVSADKSFRILVVTDDFIVSVLQLSPKHGTIEAMGILEKEFGKSITTRNWNTVVKIAAL